VPATAARQNKKPRHMPGLKLFQAAGRIRAKP
jgi:hypothetical protein